MVFVTASPKRDDQVGGHEKGEMFGGGLPGHVETLAELAQGLAVLPVELIEQFPAAGIGQGLEDSVHWEMMQPFGYMSTLGEQYNQMVAYSIGACLPR